MGDDRKTVLKFAVNAKQISTPLLDWANRLWIEGGVENCGAKRVGRKVADDGWGKGKALLGR